MESLSTAEQGGLVHRALSHGHGPTAFSGAQKTPGYC
jgi:hypothetical protein